MRAALRWIRADLRARRGQALVVILVIAGVVTALLLSATLLEGATNPWRSLFTQTRGAQIWMNLAPGSNVRTLARISGVTAVAGPYDATAATLVQGPLRPQVEVRAMLPVQPTVGRLLIRQGSWLNSSAPAGVVLEASFAQAVHVAVGASLVIEGLDGNRARVHVIGIAVTSDQGFYPDQTPGLMWALHGVLNQVEPHARPTDEVVGLRLSGPADTGFLLQQLIALHGSGELISDSTWTEVEQSIAPADPLLGLLLALFGLVALGTAVLAIANATGGRVLVQLQDLATLKTLGFTPAQVMAMVLVEHAALGLAGTAAGLLASRELTIPLLQGLPTGVLPAVTPLPAGWLVLIACGTELAVVLATAVPGLRAGRVQPLIAVKRLPPSGHLSRLARTALLSRFPPAFVLGARAAFVRRLPAALTIGGVTLSMAMIMIALGFSATVDDVQRHPADIGLAAALTVHPRDLTTAQASKIIAADPQVAAVYPSVQVNLLLPGENTTITTLGMGTTRRPYPFHVAQGRLYRATNEAVASQGLLDVLHERVGAWVRMHILGDPVYFHIVGRIIEPEYDGQVLAYSSTALSQQGVAAPPVFYSLVLRPGVNTGAAQARLLAASGNHLDVEEPADPAGQLGIVRVMITCLIVVLALVGLTSLFTASAVGLRDQLHDVGVLRAMGLTPLQVMTSLVTSTSVLALVAVTGGAIAGLALSSGLINLGAQAYGIGAGIGRPPSAEEIAVAVTVAVAAAALAAILPARRAAQLPVAAMLSP